MATHERGFVIYRGPSQIDGSPIVGIVTLESRNPKTGDMPQLWILADVGETPGAAIRSGADHAICGSCPLRAWSSTGEVQVRRCYVNPMAPASVYRTYLSGGYRTLSSRQVGRKVRGRRVRLGAYGDPTALPIDIVQALIREAKGWTGYTHQWASCDPRWSQYVMASLEADAPIPAGWRAFIVSSIPREGAIVCPASDEAGKRTTCDRCGLCNGTRGLSSKSVTIAPHGAAARQF